MKPTKFRTVQITDHHDICYYINQYKVFGLWMSIKILSSSKDNVKYRGVFNPLNATYYKLMIDALTDKDILLYDSIRICAYPNCDHNVCNL